MRSIHLPYFIALFMTMFAWWTSYATATERLDTESRQELLLLNWSDYIDPAVARAFEKQFNAQVKEIYYESDDDRDAMLAETDGRGYDLVLVNQGRLIDYVRRGWLARLDEQKIPNLRHINPRWLNFRAELAGYGVPYFGGLQVSRIGRIWYLSQSRAGYSFSGLTKNCATKS